MNKRNFNTDRKEIDRDTTILKSDKRNDEKHSEKDERKISRKEQRKELSFSKKKSLRLNESRLLILSIETNDLEAIEIILIIFD